MTNVRGHATTGGAAVVDDDSDDDEVNHTTLYQANSRKFLAGLIV